MKNLFVAMCALVLGLSTSVASADIVNGQNVIDPYETQYFDQILPSGVWIFKVQGDGDGDIDCRVYDGWGNVIARDTDKQDNCYVRLNLDELGIYRFKITNAGRIYSRYTYSLY